ncbi:MAG: hypothetical protein M0Z96_01145 [Actinomycetota bacterium]|nr:hypothetical protein [Actinomycetota bacterium]
MSSELPSLVELIVEINDNLTKAKISHGFGGAVALAYYTAEPRATDDIDLNISAPKSRIGEVFNVLPPSIKWSATDIALCAKDGQIRLWCGMPKEGIPVDLFFPEHVFHEAVAKATSEHAFRTKDYKIPIISAAHLAVFKVLFNRPQDWVDIEKMLLAGTVDLVETNRWLEELLGKDDDLLQRFRYLCDEALNSDLVTHATSEKTIHWGKYP